jgi:hypothetical protein
MMISIASGPTALPVLATIPRELTDIFAHRGRPDARQPSNHA